jgi:hypothetical protein
MPVTLQTFRDTPYRVGNLAFQAGAAGARPAVPPVPPALPTVATQFRGIHTMYPTTAGRVTLNITAPTATDARANLSGPLAAGGDTIFLKYFDEEITSIRLPCPAPGAVTLFLTDNLTGCKIYVDQIAGGNDLIVYHANTHQHSGGPLADANVQTANAINLLNQMHTDAQADYASFGVVLNNLADCDRPTYFGECGNAERRKRNQGRGPGARSRSTPGAPAQFMGGCTIAGFPSGNTWQFWYQTWGTVDYDRPDISKAKAFFTFHWNYLAKKVAEGIQHDAKYNMFEVVDYGQIF